ncbi:MAG: S8 family serine peptidase [Patescibacteria group bacterium]
MKNTPAHIKMHIKIIAIGAVLLLNAPPLAALAEEASIAAAPDQARMFVYRQQLGSRRLETRTSTSEARFVTNEIIVKFSGGKKFHRIPLLRGDTVENAIKRFRTRDDIVYAEPNYIATYFAVPNDPYYRYQWHFDNAAHGGIHAEKAWDMAEGAGATVAVVDTGVAYEDYNPGWLERYYKAPDLAGTSFIPGYDFVNNDAHPNDDEGHGTHVTGTIAQATNNNIGVAGLSHKSRIMPVKVLNAQGSGTYADIADGIRWAADNGADIINLSLGGPSGATYLEEAVRYAHDKGITVIAAAGNDGTNVLSYPAAYDDYVIAVGATRFDEARAPYSNYGAGLDIVAPGGDITVDQNNDGYGDGILQQTFGNRTDAWGYYFYQGTSMAAPHVSALAALLKGNGVAITSASIRRALQETADDLGATGWDMQSGWGLVNAERALTWTMGLSDAPPTVQLTNPAASSTVSGLTDISANASDDHGVDRVEFRVGSSLIGIATQTPYTLIWDSASVSDGLHTVSATAFDTAGQSAVAAVGITVNNVNDPPVANAGPDSIASDADNNGQQNVILDGSASYDPDGTITAYSWKEDGIVLGTTAVLSHAFAVGAHTVTLIVTDNASVESQDNVIVTVRSNQAPTASAGPDRTNIAGSAITLDGSASSDPDGAIVRYDWDFGDGTTAEGNAIVNHTYVTIGTYTAVLTVTDNGGTTARDEALITVTEQPPIVTVFIDSFETDSGQWTQDAQADWFRSNQRATEGVMSAEVDGSASDAALISIPVDLGGRTNAEISFSWFIESGLDTGEYLAFDISTDNGATWPEKARLRGNIDQENVWHAATHKLAGITALKLRFRGRMSLSSEDADVDNVRVTAW